MSVVDTETSYEELAADTSKDAPEAPEEAPEEAPVKRKPGRPPRLQKQAQVSSVAA